MTERTPLQQLAAIGLQVSDVVAWAAERNAAGHSFTTIAAEVSDAVGQPVSRETVRLWVKALDEVAS